MNPNQEASGSNFVFKGGFDRKIVSDASFDKRKTNCAGMEIPKAKRLNDLE